MKSETALSAPPVAVVLGATGQDGYLLTRRLLSEGWVVHAPVRRPHALAPLASSPEAGGRLKVHGVDFNKPAEVIDLVSRVHPDELYNLAGQSSVSLSFSDPMGTWQTNAGLVALLLECIRRETPKSRFYQASSSEMFGWVPGGSVTHDERSALNPQSPYATAKAAAHLLCRMYRQTYGLRIACGILFNHESRYRSGHFLSSKVVGHVRALRSLSSEAFRDHPPLLIGNLKVERDWGYAPDYVEGLCLILRQIDVRAGRLGIAPEPDEGAYYHDYILGTGQLHAVWQLIDRAFALAGFDLEWKMEGTDPKNWGACFKTTGDAAVLVNSDFLRPADPMGIRADPSRARNELGWTPRTGLDIFLEEMLSEGRNSLLFSGSGS